MKLTGVELRRVSMPLRAPFRTSFGTETTRDILLVHVLGDSSEGWGECVAMSSPLTVMTGRCVPSTPNAMAASGISGADIRPMTTSRPCSRTCNRSPRSATRRPSRSRRPRSERGAGTSDCLIGTDR